MTLLIVWNPFGYISCKISCGFNKNGKSEFVEVLQLYFVREDLSTLWDSGTSNHGSVPVPAVIDEGEFTTSLSSDPKNLERLVEKTGYQDYQRLGLGNLSTIGQKSRSEPFRISVVNANYSVCRRWEAQPGTANPLHPDDTGQWSCWQYLISFARISFVICQTLTEILLTAA